jgi:hypothetical protein
LVTVLAREGTFKLQNLEGQMSWGTQYGCAIVHAFIHLHTESKKTKKLYGSKSQEATIHRAQYSCKAQMLLECSRSQEDSILNSPRMLRK